MRAVDDSPDGLESFRFFSRGTALAQLKKPQQLVRAKAKSASRFNLVDAFKMGAQKYFAFVFSEIGNTLRHPASIDEGRIAIVTRREAGCGGR